MNIDKAINSAFIAYKQRNLPEAENLSKKILKKQPRQADALHLLGMICFDRGDPEQAITYIQKALRIDPAFAAAYNNLGNIYQSLKRSPEAIACYQKAVELNPALEQTYMNLGIVLQDEGRFDQAIESYRKVIGLNPDHFGAYNNLGLALQALGNTEESIACYQKAIRINPHFAEAHNNLGNALKANGQRDKAKSSYEQAIVLNPDYAEAYNNLGLLLKEEGYLDDAIAHMEKALSIRSDFVDACNNLGTAYHAKGNLKEALSYYQRATEIDPRYVQAYNNMGNALKDAGHLDQAEQDFRHALEIQPDCNIAYSNILFTMNYNDRYSPESVYSGHIKFAEQYEKPLKADHPHQNDPAPGRRLKIGYVSPDFRTHSVAYFIEPVLSAHNRDNYEIFCYADVVAPDSTTKRLQGLADHWLNIVGKSDDVAAELIRKHRIDILVDLAGHTGNNRMLLFARKPAPVQMTWIGYPATTGLSSMDYKIVDTYTDPPGVTDHFYTEELIRLPGSFLCYLPPPDCPEVADLPALSTGQVCFGSFNNFSKVSSATVGMWARILELVPNSRLVLKAKCFSDKQTRQHAEEIFSAQGVDSERIQLLPWEPSSRPHLTLYNRIDIALDTFPYSGTTTTCEALCMGVPVITLAGNSHASRVGTSLLANIGLPELIAQTPEEYVTIAVDLARNPKKLQSLRTSLRGMLSHSPITDAGTFTRHLEEAYRKMWVTWCRKQGH